VLLIIVILLPLAAFAADLAGWDRTRWGMRSPEITALYGKRAMTLDGRIEFAGLYSDVALRHADFAGYDFTVYFQMDNATQRLAQVLLERRRQYATMAVWNAMTAALERNFGAPTARCDQPGRPFEGDLAVIERVWVLPTTTVRASFIAFNVVTPDHAPEDDGGLARRLLIRYAPTRKDAAACP
jgi:hypothetical protein